MKTKRRPGKPSGKEGERYRTYPRPLRDFSQQRGEVQLSGSPATLLEALQLLWATYPGLRDRLLTEEGQLREHINIFVGNESIRYTGGLATPSPPTPPSL